MKKFNALLLLSLTSLMVFTACSGTPNYVGEDELGGGQVDNETGTSNTDVSDLKVYLQELSQFRNYTYTTEYNYIDSNGVSHSQTVVDYYGDHFFYEDNKTIKTESFGLAEEATGGEKNVFYFYFDQEEMTEDKLIPSLYYYTYDYASTAESVVPMTDLFGGTGVAGLHSFYDDVFDELAGIKVSDNEYQVLSSSCISIFQYMTQVGSSISNMIAGVDIKIIDFDTYETEITVDLGNNGSITSKLEIFNDGTTLDFIDSKLTDGSMKGVSHYEDVATLFENKLSQNNYTITDIKNTTEIGVDQGTFSVYLTENYFLLDYTDQYNQQGYNDFGRMYLPANTEVEIYDLSTMEHTTVSHTYGGCYEFDIIDGSIYFTSFIGPNEENNTKYIEVATYDDLASLSSDQLNEDYLYIVLDENVAYRYGMVDGATGEYGFLVYDDWFNSVGDFPIGSSTFYTSSTIFGELGRYYFEKDIHEENHYYSEAYDVIYAMGTSLFGFGFQQTTTWLESCYSTDLRIQKANDDISSCDLSMSYYGPDGDSTYSYHIEEIGTTSVQSLDEVYSSLVR